MKVTYNWLKDFVEIRIPAEKLAAKLTMAGLEVTSLEEKAGDFVFEIEVTSNRPDCLSVVGIAREVAAITGKKLKLDPGSWILDTRRNKNRKPRTENQNFEIKIEDKRDCPLYTAKIIQDVKVGPSPAWLARRLELVGCRSVNNIVDIANYILFTWGQPLHAFDLDKLGAGAIFVRRAKEGEKITTLDGQPKILNHQVLVIANKDKPIAVAGVMGGQDTEVSLETTRVLLESAAFNPIQVRRSRQRLGIESESSYRFERGVDLEKVEPASWQAVKLIKELARGTYLGGKSRALFKPPKVSINLNTGRVEKVLGRPIARAKIKSILQDLGFSALAKNKNNFLVKVPGHRQDIRLEIDLVEELARVFGYENIPSSLPAVKPQITLSDTRGLVSLLKNILVASGLNEVVTNTLIDRQGLKNWGTDEAQAIPIANPLNSEQAVLRPSIIPSLLRCLALNLNQKQEPVNIFEVAPAFLTSRQGLPQEELILGLAAGGEKSRFTARGVFKEEIDSLHLKGVLETLFSRLGIKDYGFIPQANLETEVSLAGEKAGAIYQLNKAVAEKFEIKNKAVFAAEVYLDKVFRRVNLKKQFRQLPVYPGISRDISLILKEEIAYRDILKAIKENASTFLKEIKVVDYYRGSQIPPGFKGLTISCFYRADERTLTEAEINPLHSAICRILTERFAATIR